MLTAGYFPYAETQGSAEAEWLGEHLSLDVRVAQCAPSLNDASRQSLPALWRLWEVVRNFLALPAVVAEGPRVVLLWAALLRARGFKGTVIF